MADKVGIVAALEREVKAGIRGWRVVQREHEGRRYKFFENDRAVLVCGGIGAEAARRATEALIILYDVRLVVSAGFAGALDSGLKIGDQFTPRWVVGADDGSRIDTGAGSGTLVSFGSIASIEQKGKLARAYAAQAVDMEAAAVARGAQARGVPFVAYKTVSDEYDFAAPPLEGFVAGDGQFQTASFALFAVVRPWLWPGLVQLKRNSARAAETLAAWLDQYRSGESLEKKATELHPINRA
jgi:adenosylhomocysteine nucleosidase